MVSLDVDCVGLEKRTWRLDHQKLVSPEGAE